MTDESKEILKAIAEVKQDVKSIQLTLENVTNKNIQIIAEGHLDLSRKLNQALQIEDEKEMLKIKINTLENELRKLKERVDRIA